MSSSYHESRYGPLMNVGPRCEIQHVHSAPNTPTCAYRQHAALCSSALCFRHLCPLALFCKNCLALPKRVGAAHAGTAAFASDGFVLPKRSTVTSCGGVGSTPKWSVGFVLQELSLTFSSGTVTDTGVED